MTKALFATYGGKQHLFIDEPLELPPETKVKIIVEVDEEVMEVSQDHERGAFDVIVSESRHLGISDWSENHDHYLLWASKA